MIIKKKGITYNYDNDGETIVSAKVDYSSYDGRNSLNATVAITLDMMKDVESWDSVTPKMMDTAARVEIQKWLEGTNDSMSKAPVTVKENSTEEDMTSTGNPEDGSAVPETK